MTTKAHDSLLAAHPVEIFQACDSVFSGYDWLSWEPETILLELKQEVSDAAVDKLLAVQAVAANSKAVQNSAAAFEKVVNAFCNNICVMDVIQPPEVEEMSYAVSQINKIIEMVQGSSVKLSFGGEVPAYVASVARFRGWFALPSNLSFGQELLDNITNMPEGSKLRKEHYKLLDAVSSAVYEIRRTEARELLEDGSVEALEGDETSSNIARKIIGALLYDPTLPYRVSPDVADAKSSN